jgi:hypothetical protein
MTGKRISARKVAESELRESLSRSRVHVNANRVCDVNGEEKYSTRVRLIKSNGISALFLFFFCASSRLSTAAFQPSPNSFPESEAFTHKMMANIIAAGNGGGEGEDDDETRTALE